MGSSMVMLEISRAGLVSTFRLVNSSLRARVIEKHSDFAMKKMVVRFLFDPSKFNTGDYCWKFDFSQL